MSSDEFNSTIPNTAVLFKTDPSKSDAYVDILEKEGIKGFALTSFSIEFLKSPELREALNHPEKYAGIIFSSKKSVEAVKMYRPDETTMDVWRQKCNFTVYKTTKELANVELDMPTMGHETGSMNNLVEIIKSGRGGGEAKPYLHPCSSISRLDVFTNNPTISVHSIPCYRPAPDPLLLESWANLCREINGLPEYVMFFSPSGVDFTKGLFEKYDLRRFKVIALGPTTADKLRYSRIEPIFVPAKPSAESLAESLKHYLSL